MRSVHRLVIVAGMFLMLPVYFVVHTTYAPPSFPDLLLAGAIAVMIIGFVVYPITWLISGFRHQ